MRQPLGLAPEEARRDVQRCAHVELDEQWRDVGREVGEAVVEGQHHGVRDREVGFERRRVLRDGRRTRAATRDDLQMLAEARGIDGPLAKAGRRRGRDRVVTENGDRDAHRALVDRRLAV